MPDATPEPPAGRSFEDMLADPGEQFDPRSELLASIAAYAAAPSDTPSAAPRPLTAPGVVAGLLADVAERDERLAVQHEAMTQLRAGHGEALAAMTAKLDRALAANQRGAQTLGDVQQRHAEVKRERDAHKVRADHYEGLWRAEHGLPAEGNEAEGNHA
jgi:hypothetical protein